MERSVKNHPEATVIADFLSRLGHGASVLLLDYDGTLAPFRTERDRAYPYPGVLPILRGIIQSGRTRVIVISGRPAREVQNLLRPIKNLEVWGAHGLEHLLPDGTYRQTGVAPETAALLAQEEDWLSQADLSRMAEVKPGGIAIHWRGLSESEIESVRNRTQEKWTSLAERPGLKLLHFEGGLELRTAYPDKGDAVSAILEESDPNVPVAVLGDDLTDEDAFRVLNEHGRGLSILVRPAYRETVAKAWLRPPVELVGFLEQWRTGVSAYARDQ